MRSWFHEQLLARAIASAVWSVVLQVPLILVLKLLFSGYQGLWNSLSLFLHYGSIFSILLIPVCICGYTFSHIKYYKVEPVVFLTRWTIIKELFSLNFVLILSLYGIITGVLMNSYFSMAIPFLGSLSTQCIIHEKQAWCLNEAHVLGVFFGGWLGLSEAVEYFFSNRRLVKIPHVQLHIKAAVWSSVVPLIKNSLRASLKRYLTYAFIYLLFGSVVRSYILAVTRLSLSEPLDTIFNLINISLALRCVLIGAACIFTIRLSNLLFQLYQVKSISFPIVRFGDDTTPLLQEALNSETPLLRLWACRDWSILAEQSEERRSIIFSVSQPGNHPHNWNSVLAAIQPQCVRFISMLKAESKVIKPDPQETVAAQVPPPYDTFTSPTRMRSMALKSPSKEVANEPSKLKFSLQVKLQSKLQEIIGTLKKKPIIAFFWGDLPEAKRRQTFAKAEPIIYLVEGLSHLIAASYVEDKYGVVQKDLPDVLSMLLDMQTALEQRGPSSGAPPKRTEAFVSSSPDVQFKDRLKWTIKSSIYRLVVRFQRHILNVPLSPPQKQMLEQYLEFRVG